MTPRWPALVLLVALAVGALVVGRDAPDPTPPTSPDPASLLPAGPPADALDSTWFCAGQTVGDGTAADGTIVIANVGDETATGRLDVVTDGGDQLADGDGQPLEIPPQTTERIRLADLLEADWASAQVTLDRGDVAVEHEVEGPQGRDAAPCHSAAADRWYLPSGATTRDARYYLAVYNPTTVAATVDMEFATVEGPRQPGDLQGIPVGPRSMVAVNVAAAVTVRDLIAATVTARRGQIVVDRIQTFDGRGASSTEEEAAEETYRRTGLTVTPAVPAARPTWTFPAGVRAVARTSAGDPAGGVHEVVYVFNPGAREVDVSVDIALDDPRRNGRLDPIPLTVASGEVATFDVDATPGVPEDVRHSITVSTEGGRSVVVERALIAEGETDYVGVATGTGSPVAARRWVFAAGGRSDDLDAVRIALVNPGDEAVDVELVAFGDGERSAIELDEAVTLDPGGRREVVVEGLPEGRGSIEVTSSGPVVAERRILATRDGDGEPGLGASAALGIPFGALVLLD